MHEFGIMMDDCEVMHTKIKNSRHSKFNTFNRKLYIQWTIMEIILLVIWVFINSLRGRTNIS
jgi:hypothetical protein